MTPAKYRTSDNLTGLKIFYKRYMAIREGSRGRQESCHAIMRIRSSNKGAGELIAGG